MAESKLNFIQKNNLYEIIHKSCKERDVVTNAWEEIANSLVFLLNGTYYISKA